MGAHFTCRWRASARPSRPRHWSGRSVQTVDVVTRHVRFGFLWLPFKGFQHTSTHRRVDGLWVLVWDRYWEDEVVKKVTLSGTAGRALSEFLASKDSKLLAKLPNLLLHITVTAYEDGSARKPGWVTIKIMGSNWVAQVKDPDACAQLQVMGPDLDDVLKALDVLLAADGAPWEPDPFLSARQPS